jgi:serralysin
MKQAVVERALLATLALLCMTVHAQAQHRAAADAPTKGAIVSRPPVQLRPLPRPAPILAPAAKLCVEMPRPPGQLPALPTRNYLRVAPDGSVVGVNRGALAAVTDRIWEAGQTLRVRFNGGSAALRLRVQRVAEEWRPHANVRFIFVADDQPAEIRIGFVSGDGSWSLIGRDALLVPASSQTMNFGWLADDTADDELRRVVLHEFGHALGLIHEHQSPVASIRWDVPKVYAWYSKNLGWDEATVNANLLTKYDAATTNYSAYDPTSIMQYPVSASLTLDGTEIGWNINLSSMDQAAIRAWYPFPVTSRGTLRTGDDCDSIAFTLTEGVMPAGQFLVRLGTGGPVNWWKSIKVPFTGGGLHEIQVGGIGAESGWVFWHHVLDNSRAIRFSKAKFLGIHTELGFTWDVVRALPDRGELLLVWNRDSCRQ